MSHFYGSIPTSARKTIPTARGHKSTGRTVEAASYAGKVRTRFWHEGGIDYYEVWAVPHFGEGATKLLASGKVGQ